MKILLSILLLFSFAAKAQDTTKYMPMSAKGYKFNGGTFKNIWIGQDTTNYKTGIVRIGFRFFVGNGVYWKEIAGGSSAPSGLTGAVVTQIDSTRFNVSPGSYYIQGSLYANGDTTFNLAQPGDTSRIDVIGLDTLGQVFTITGVESENPYPSSIDPLSQIYLSFVWVDTDTVYFAPTPVNYWSALGNDIIPNNPGKVQFKNGLYVDQITANDSRLFSSRQIILQSNRTTGSKIYAGITGGNTALNTTELQLSLGDNSTTGTAKTALSLTGGSLHASGTEEMNMISITPSIVQSGSYSGSVRGIYYNPTVTSNVGTHYAFESTAGRIKFGGMETGDTTTYNYFVITDANGNLRKFPVFSGGGGGSGASQNLDQVAAIDSALNHTIIAYSPNGIDTLSLRDSIVAKVSFASNTLNNTQKQKLLERIQPHNYNQLDPAGKKFGRFNKYAISNNYNGGGSATHRQGFIVSEGYNMNPSGGEEIAGEGYYQHSLETDYGRTFEDYVQVGGNQPSTGAFSYRPYMIRAWKDTMFQDFTIKTTFLNVTPIDTAMVFFKTQNGITTIDNVPGRFSSSPSNTIFQIAKSGRTIALTNNGSNLAFSGAQTSYAFDKNILPTITATQDLGGASAAWQTIYTRGLIAGYRICTDANQTQVTTDCTMNFRSITADRTLTLMFGNAPGAILNVVTGQSTYKVTFTGTYGVRNPDGTTATELPAGKACTLVWDSLGPFWQVVNVSTNL